MKHFILTVVCCLLLSAVYAQVGENTVIVKYQNPINQTTDLELEVKELVDLELALYGGRGEFVKLLMKQELMAGTHQIPVVVSDVPAGDYMLMIQYGSFQKQTPFNVEHLSVNPLAEMPAKKKGIGVDYGVSETTTSKPAVTPLNEPILTGNVSGQPLDKPVPYGISETTTAWNTKVSKSRSGDLSTKKNYETMPDGGGNTIVYGIDAPSGTTAKRPTTLGVPSSTPTVVGASKNAPKVEFLNPVRSGNNIRITLDNMQDIELRLVDNNGKFIKLLMKQELMKGMHDIPVIVSDIPQGIYLLEIMANGEKEIKSLQVVH